MTHLSLSGVGLDTYLKLSGAGLDAYFKRVVLGQVSGHFWGERLQISLGSMCQNGLDDMHIFGVQVRALLKSSNEVQARVCEANSFQEVFMRNMECKRNVPTEQKEEEERNGLR